MKKINLTRKIALYMLFAFGIMLAGFSSAEAQRRGGGRSFGGGARISGGYRGGFGGGNRIASVPRYAPGRTFGGIRGGVAIRPGYSYGRPYYRGDIGRPYYGVGIGPYYRGYYPRIGFRISVLPFGYYPFYFGGYPYYYNEGLFYRQYPNGSDYEIVAPPVGAVVPRLPRGAADIVIDGQKYFEKDGVYYQKIVDENGRKAYRVAGKDGVLNTDGNNGQQDDQQQYNDNNTAQQPYNNNERQQPQMQPQQQSSLPRVGDVVNTIPSDSRKVTINGEKLFVSPDGVYYQEDSSGNSRIFKVVGVPPAEDGADAVVNP